MKCKHCSEASIELIHCKDRNTGFHSNYWWCNMCEKKTEPYNEMSFRFVVFDYMDNGPVLWEDWIKLNGGKG